ncbi:MAG: diguanylate cyclase [Gammaproteobacteria bacterium]
MDTGSTNGPGQQARRDGGETVARLQRGILRLALAHHGRNAELDRKLKEFGASVRSGRRQAERGQMIDDIVDTIVALDLEHEPAADADAGHQSLFDFLRHLAVPDTLRPEIERTERALNGARNRAEALAHVRQAAQTLSRYLMRSPESTPDAVVIRMLFSELIDRLPLPRHLVAELAPLRRALDGAEEARTFLACVDTLAELIERLRAELQEEIDGLGAYLRGVAGRLAEFDQFVNRTESARASCDSDTLQLSETLGKEIGLLRDFIDINDDLDKVRAAIDEHLGNIDEGLSQFVAAQDVRSSEAESALRSMTAKLRDLEEQTEHLREDLEQQHARILIDPLTNVLNRTGYTETATKHVARWKRYGGKLSLAVIDLDLFKHINDAYGHAAGDRVLATVATKLREGTREADVLCRYGGEEFVLILPETDADSATKLLEKLRENIERCQFRHKETPVQVTLSCGVAEFHDGDTLETVFERADQAMYLAKSNGRNRVCSDDAAEPRQLSAIA